MYHEIQLKNGEKYHYLSESIRVGKGKWKKVRVYLGKGEMPKDKLDALISKEKKTLKSVVSEAKRAHDPLISLLSEEKTKELEGAKRKYKKVLSSGKYVREKRYEWFVTKFTYDTNAIEGSSITLQETGLILFDRIVPEGRSIKEIRETENHKDAFDLMLNYKGEINKRFVLNLHKTLMHNILWNYAGRFRDVQVMIRGTDFLPPQPNYVESEFKRMMKWYASNKRRYHPVIITAYFHAMFESIHPFMDGNGRIGRLLLNFILKKNGYPLVNIKNKDRGKYYICLSAYQKHGNLKPLVDLISTYILKEGEISV